MNLERLVRTELLQLEDMKFRYDEPDDDAVKLDLNENFLVELPSIRRVMSEVVRKVDIRRYPPAYAQLAVDAISRFHRIDPAFIFVGNGADGILERILRVFTRDGCRVGIVEPTFSWYSYFVALNKGVKVPIYLRDDFSLDINALSRSLTAISLLVICSPNNPTGNQFEARDIRRLVEQVDGLVILDEAYADFGRYSAVNWTKEYDNLLVVRSFSKSFGLAGARIGYAVASPELIKYLRRATHPFETSTFNQMLLAGVLARWKRFKKIIDKVKFEREWLRNQLVELDAVTPYHSDANFMLIRFAGEGKFDAAKRLLADERVFFRARQDIPMLKSCMRITVGTRRMNRKFLSAIARASG